MTYEEIKAMIKRCLLQGGMREELKNAHQEIRRLREELDDATDNSEFWCDKYDTLKKQLEEERATVDLYDKGQDEAWDTINNLQQTNTALRALVEKLSEYDCDNWRNHLENCVEYLPDQPEMWCASCVVRQFLKALETQSTKHTTTQPQDPSDVIMAPNGEEYCPCALERIETPYGVKYDCAYETADGIVCEDCIVNGGPIDPRKPKGECSVCGNDELYQLVNEKPCPKGCKPKETEE